MSEDRNPFIQRCLRSEARLDEIDDVVELWHSGQGGRQLHEFLGMDKREYALWLNDPGAMHSIVAGRRSGSDLRHVAQADH